MTRVRMFFPVFATRNSESPASDGCTQHTLSHAHRHEQRTRKNWQARAGSEQRGLRDTLGIRSCACTGEACYEQIEAALAAVVAKNTGSICVNDALRDPYTSNVFDV